MGGFDDGHVRMDCMNWFYFWIEWRCACVGCWRAGWVLTVQENCVGCSLVFRRYTMNLHNAALVSASSLFYDFVGKRITRC